VVFRMTRADARHSEAPSEARGRRILSYFLSSPPKSFKVTLLRLIRFAKEA